MQLNSGLNWNQLIKNSLRIGEVAEETTISSWLFIDAFNHLGPGAERQQLRKEEHRGQRQGEDKTTGQQKTQASTPPRLRGTTAASDGNVIAAAVTLPAAGGDSPGQMLSSRLFRS
jgi:hypothetical protein